MRFASLGSGSRGNALVVDAGETCVMVDCGFSTRSTVERLACLGIEPERLGAVLITHEHSDHVAGVARFSARFGIPVFLTHGTFSGLGHAQSLLKDYHLIDSHQAFGLGALQVQPFPVPHDAREPVQYVFSDGARRLGIVTDCGMVTAHVIEMLHRCEALVVECNHDPAMLASSAYPASLKRRIAGNFGHLANAQAASLLAQIECSRLQHVIAAHLSEENNSVELAREALAGVLGCADDWIGIASQDEGFGWRQLV